jgi:hypothetical protein
MAGVTQRYELSRWTQKIRNSDTNEEILGMSKRPGSESERDSGSQYCIRNVFYVQL